MENSLFLHNWKCLNGKSVENLELKLCENIEALLKTNVSKSNIKIVTACDSQRRKNSVIYVTVIIVLNIHHGGFGFYLKEIENYNQLFATATKQETRREIIKSLINKRLWNETSKAIQCALSVNSILNKYGLKVTEIHADINKNKKYKSAELYKAITGYIDACGFIPKVKPDAWGASSIANEKTK